MKPDIPALAIDPSKRANAETGCDPDASESNLQIQIGRCHAGSGGRNIGVVTDLRDEQWITGRIARQLGRRQHHLGLGDPQQVSIPMTDISPWRTNFREQDTRVLIRGLLTTWLLPGRVAQTTALVIRVELAGSGRLIPSLRPCESLVSVGRFGRQEQKPDTARRSDVSSALHPVKSLRSMASRLRAALPHAWFSGIGQTTLARCRRSSQRVQRV